MMPMLLFFLTHLFGLTQDLFAAQAVGDRFRFLDAIRKLRGLLGDVDPMKIADGVAKLLAWLTANPELLAWIKKLLGGMTLGGPTVSTAHAMDYTAMSDSDYAAAGILDNPGGWMKLVQGLLAIAKLIWGPDVIPFAATTAALTAQAAPIDANATK